MQKLVSFLSWHVIVIRCWIECYKLKTSLRYLCCGFNNTLTFYILLSQCLVHFCVGSGVWKASMVKYRSIPLINISTASQSTFCQHLGWHSVNILVNSQLIFNWCIELLDTRPTGDQDKCWLSDHQVSIKSIEMLIGGINQHSTADALVHMTQSVRSYWQDVYAIICRKKSLRTVGHFAVYQLEVGNGNLTTEVSLQTSSELHVYHK